MILNVWLVKFVVQAITMLIPALTEYRMRFESHVVWPFDFSCTWYFTWFQNGGWCRRQGVLPGLACFSTLTTVELLGEETYDLSYFGGWTPMNPGYFGVNLNDVPTLWVDSSRSFNFSSLPTAHDRHSKGHSWTLITNQLLTVKLLSGGWWRQRETKSEESSAAHKMLELERPIEFDSLSVMYDNV